MIKTWEERCVEHPDHQTGMVSYAMIQARMQEEIDELRAAVFDPDWDRVKALEESLREHMAEIQRLKALRAALAQPEQEPVGWLESPHGAFRANLLYKLEFPSQLLAWSVPLYTHPPQRKLLTENALKAEFAKLYKSDAAILHLAENNRNYALESIGARHHWTAFESGARAIEKAHGIE